MIEFRCNFFFKPSFSFIVFDCLWPFISVDKVEVKTLRAIYQNAPINVKSKTVKGAGNWHFSNMCGLFPCPRANHYSQMHTNFLIPGCTLLSNIPRLNLRKVPSKISRNLTLQSLSVDIAASPKIRWMFLLKSQLQCVELVWIYQNIP